MTSPRFTGGPGTAPAMVCRRCGEPLNRYRFQAFGAATVTWKHGRLADYDHHPDPIPRREATTVTLVCDFCCGDARVEWRYDTSRETGVAWVSTDTPRNVLAEATQSTTWAACAACAEHIERRDIPGLVTHVCTVTPQFAAVPRAAFKAHFREFFNNKISGRIRMPGPTSPTPEQ